MEQTPELPEYAQALLNPETLSLLANHKIDFSFCRQISKAATHLNATLNEQGFSEEWDRGGLFSATTKTIYVAEQGWEFGGPKVYPGETRVTNLAHEAGHAVDFCLGRPSRSDEFRNAVQKDIESFPYAEKFKSKLLGRFLIPVVGAQELWANFYEFSVSGKYREPAHLFPNALEVFNEKCLGLDIPLVSIGSEILKRETTGGIIEIKTPKLERTLPSAPDRPTQSRGPTIAPPAGLMQG